ncbi:aspartate aminotransferase family protein [Parvularcula sp. ZS-1/3]|uniref:Aspartate aminotransferase family protein n=1 Tax=Parvularcula mediterranea TaxID=2732508 RepID=A0A7Y3W6P7_9PROT|nr:pyridoxal-dependent decarboxylase [Parvularcula mediterranea]NNU17511.1 aspartate aminotransferase family protein [Parvularcula mediterranea]
MTTQNQTTSLLEAAHRASVAYTRDIKARSVAPSPEALSALQDIHSELPEGSCDPLEVFDRIDRLGSPATVATTGGRFFGYVVGGALPVTIAAAQLAAAWDQNAGTWNLSPPAAEMETVVSRWLLELLDLPRTSVVGFVTGSTMGTFSAIAAARSAVLKRLGWNMKRQGLAGSPPLRIVTSTECHPTNFRALGYAGIGLDQVEYVPTDHEGRLDPNQMPELDDHTIVLLQAGNINSGSMDPFSEVCDLAKCAGAWVHIDGAFGLWARGSRQTKAMTNGVELADSWCVDGHKWLNLPQDNAIYACRDAEAVHDVYGVNATYLIRDGGVREPQWFTPELSRRSRGVEWYAALATLGREGVEDLINRSCRHAERFAQGLSRAGYEILNDVTLNQVVFALPSDAETKLALESIQKSGVTWLGPTTWKGRYAMRISVSSAATTECDVEQSLQAMVSAVPACRSAGADL